MARFFYSNWNTLARVCNSCLYFVCHGFFVLVISTEARRAKWRNLFPFRNRFLDCARNDVRKTKTAGRKPCGFCY